jgi:type II secretory pathway pseudopilin PulG
LSQPQPSWGPPAPPPAKSNTTLIIAIVVIVVVVVAVIGGIFAIAVFNIASTSNLTSRTQQSANIVNGLITVQAGGYNYYPFTMAAGTTSISVNGSFTASGGSGNDIAVFVMDETNFINWKNGHQANAYYSSGQLTTGTISATLPSSGAYDLVYSNTFSTFSSKNVQTTVNVYYYG